MDEAAVNSELVMRTIVALSVTLFLYGQPTPSHAQSRECMAAQQQCQDAQQSYRRCLGINNLSGPAICSQMRSVVERSCDQGQIDKICNHDRRQTSGSCGGDLLARSTPGQCRLAGMKYNPN